LLLSLSLQSMVRLFDSLPYAGSQSEVLYHRKTWVAALLLALYPLRLEDPTTTVGGAVSMSPPLRSLVLPFQGQLVSAALPAMVEAVCSEESQQRQERRRRQQQRGDSSMRGVYLAAELLGVPAVMRRSTLLHDDGDDAVDAPGASGEDDDITEGCDSDGEISACDQTYPAAPSTAQSQFLCSTNAGDSLMRLIVPTLLKCDAVVMMDLAAAASSRIIY
jgi:hypothetical protein